MYNIIKLWNISNGKNLKKKKMAGLAWKIFKSCSGRKNLISRVPVCNQFIITFRFLRVRILGARVLVFPLIPGLLNRLLWDQTRPWPCFRTPVRLRVDLEPSQVDFSRRRISLRMGFERNILDRRRFGHDLVTRTVRVQVLQRVQVVFQRYTSQHIPQER